VELDYLIPRSPRPEPEAGAVDPKIATVGVSTACAKWSGALSFVTSTAARRNCLHRLTDGQPSAPTDRMTTGSRDCRGDLRREARILGSADHHDPRSLRQALRQLSVVRPALRAPRSIRRQRDEPFPDAVLPQEALRRRAISERDVQRRAGTVHRHARECQHRSIS